MPALNDLAKRVRPGTTETYADAVHFVHVYVIEPHPMAPDVSPYKGVVWEMEHSTVAQPLTFEDRVANAARMVPLVEGNQLLLVDDLAPGTRTNPVWCTYGPAPSAAYVIAQDGAIHGMQAWREPAAMEHVIDDLLGP